MVFKITWAPRALDDLRCAVAYIARRNSDAAYRFGIKLIETAESLEHMPERGRMIPKFHDPDLRDVPCPPYRIAYRIVRELGQARVEIVRLWHGARDPESFEL